MLFANVAALVVATQFVAWMLHRRDRSIWWAVLVPILYVPWARLPMELLAQTSADPHHAVIAGETGGAVCLLLACLAAWRMPPATSEPGSTD